MWENLVCFRVALVYLMLKCICDGEIEINAPFLNKVSQSLQISQRTIKRALDWLAANNWVKNEYGTAYRFLVH